MAREVSVIATAYTAEIRAMRCVLCTVLSQAQETKTQAHHLRAPAGGGQKASDFLTIPLCRCCHTGKLGIHGDRSLLRIARCTEYDLLALTIQARYRQHGA